MNRKFKNQASLLLRILPLVAKEKAFALHGGTAINLFYQNMPRLSVDIDLTYVPIKNRNDDLADIRSKLLDIGNNIKRHIPNIHIKSLLKESDEPKLYCSINGALVKVEVNTINRGLIDIPNTKSLCNSAQEEFNTFTEIQIVPKSQLYGGKIVAALDRQHPRDLFDVKKMFETHGYSKEIHKGFVFCLLSSNRPFHEILNPKLIDRKTVMESQFNGMTNELFTYEMFYEIRAVLIEKINFNLSPDDKKLLVSFTEGNPLWQNYNYMAFPGVQWKLLNINKLKNENFKKHTQQLNKLIALLK